MLNGEKSRRGTSVDVKVRQGSSVNRMEKKCHKTINSKGVINKSFTNQRKGSRVINTLDTKLNALQSIIYATKKTKHSIPK